MNVGREAEPDRPGRARAAERRSPAGRSLPLVVWSLLVAYVTLTPQPFGRELESAAGLDLAAHFILFGIWTWLSLRAAASGRAGENAPPALPVPAILAILLALAVLDEWLQVRIPGRSASWLDLAADGLGVFAFARLWRRAAALPAQQRSRASERV